MGALPLAIVKPSFSDNALPLLKPTCICSKFFAYMSLVKVNEKLSRIMQNLFLKIANQSRIATSLTSQSPILVDRILPLWCVSISLFILNYF
ncbi:hypothetical protein A7X13_03370 [Helicobacter pullorum]|nr:hypothetical protein A7X13_03370 [Helicobacter pullorum]